VATLACQIISASATRRKKGMTSVAPERRLALIHRVIAPDKEYPKEYAILVTDRRSIFIRQEKTRSSFVLRGEMRYGTALVTDVKPKTLEDYEQTSLGSLRAESGGFTVPHDSVTSLVMRREAPRFRVLDFFIWLTMRRQGEIFQVYDFAMNYRQSPNREAGIRFYAVPLGAYFKPRRQTSIRETILREYAMGVLETFQQVLPAGIISLEPRAARSSSQPSVSSGRMNDRPASWVEVEIWGRRPRMFAVGLSSILQGSIHLGRPFSSLRG